MPEENNKYANMTAIDLLTTLNAIENQIILGERIMNHPINKTFYKINATTVSKMKIAQMEIKEEFFKEANGTTQNADYKSAKLANEFLEIIKDKQYKSKGADK